MASGSTLFDTYRARSIKILRRQQQEAEQEGEQNATDNASTNTTTAPSLSPLTTRHDPHSYTQCRPMFIQTGIISSALGSSYLEISPHTKIFASCYAPVQLSFASSSSHHHQQHSTLSSQGTLSVDFSYHTTCNIIDGIESKGREHRRRESNEERYISSTLQSILSTSIPLHRYPRSVIQLCILVVESDDAASVMHANKYRSMIHSITAGCMALADAGIEMYDLQAAVTIVARPHTHQAPTDYTRMQGTGHQDQNQSPHLIVDPTYDEYRHYVRRLQQEHTSSIVHTHTQDTQSPTAIPKHTGAPIILHCAYMPTLKQWSYMNLIDTTQSVEEDDAFVDMLYELASRQCASLVQHMKDILIENVERTIQEQKKRKQQPSGTGAAAPQQLQPT